MFRPFTSRKINKQDQPPQTEPQAIRVVITGVDQNETIPFKKVIAENLKAFDLFSVAFENEQETENFLNLDNKNFFDFLDSGLKILSTHQADILIRIYHQKNNIRLNFQTANIYERNDVPFFSLLNSLYLPLSCFKQEKLPQAISTLIASTLVALNIEKDKRFEALISHLVDILSKNKIPQEIEAEFVPHILNFLALNYLCARPNGLEKQDVQSLLNLLDFAFKHVLKNDDVLLKGHLLTTLGQMYQASIGGKKADAYILLQRAIESYKRAQKHFNRYVFPYDYGRLSLVLAKLYFQFFKLSDDGQTLRDAVFHLREAEKIFTFAAFPEKWAQIQKDLGIYLLLLSSRSNNEEIAELAVQSFKNVETVFEKQKYPEKFADMQIQIGNLYYYLGKNISNKEYLEKAADYYTEAFDVFAKLQKKDRLTEIESYLEKVDQEIMRLI